MIGKGRGKGERGDMNTSGKFDIKLQPANKKKNPPSPILGGVSARSGPFVLDFIAIAVNKITGEKKMSATIEMRISSRRFDASYSIIK